MFESGCQYIEHCACDPNLLRLAARVKLTVEERAWVACLLQLEADRFNTSYHADSMEGSYLQIARDIQTSVTRAMRAVPIDSDEGVSLNLSELDALSSDPESINVPSSFIERLKGCAEELRAMGAWSIYDFYC